jgi:advillin
MEPLETSLPYNPRFFSCNSSTGSVELEELPYFTQSDLKGVIILDYLDEIFIWLENNSQSKNEVSISIESMQKYITLSAIHQKMNVKLWVTFRNREPLAFKRAFQGWEYSLSLDEECIDATIYYQELRREIYPLAVLTSSAVPAHVNRSKLETYLSDVEFKEIFKMSRREYESMPLWKQVDAKKKCGFF